MKLRETPEQEKERLLKELQFFPLEVLRLAVIYAFSYREYGEDITKAWATAVHQTKMLSEAYQKGQKDMYDALMRGNDNG